MGHRCRAFHFGSIRHFGLLIGVFWLHSIPGRAEEGSASDTADAPEAETPLDDPAFLEPIDTSPEVDETVVRGERPQREATRHQVTSEEINKIPGIHGDAVLAIQTLPGVGKPPALLGEIYIRGSAHHESASLIDGLYVPTVFHFGAVNSIINSDLIEAVSFYPGNFSVRYGRAIGGVVDIETRAPNTERLHAYLDVDLWDTTAFAEGPIGDKWSVAASFRRSYIDAILEATGLLENQLQFTAAPRYYDFQAVADYHPSSRDNLRLLVFGSDDKMRFGDAVFNDTVDLLSSLNTHAYVYQGLLKWTHRFDRTLSSEFSFGFGYFGSKDLGESFGRKSSTVPVHLREEVTWHPHPFVLLRFGTDSGLGWHRETVDGTDLIGISRPVVRKRLESHPSLYTELELLAIMNTQIIYGLRLDYHSAIEKWGLDPRVTVRHAPTDLTTFKAGFGLFQQPPKMYQTIADSSEDLALAQAVHYSAGIEQKVPGYPHLEFEMEGFFKDLRRLIYPSSGMNDYIDAGLGRAFGLELQVTHRPWKHFFGWISYTLMRSQYRRRLENEPVLFPRDQTHVLTLVAGVAVKWNIDLGIRFRLASGFPYTPIAGVQFVDGFANGYVGIRGESHSARMPLFHQLDVRIDKTWQGKTVAFSAYLDVQNVYNRQNAVFYLYSRDYAQKKPVYDLPVLPSLGLRLEY